VSNKTTEKVLQQIQAETKRIVEDQLDQMLNTPRLAPIIINRKVGARRRKQIKLLRYCT
jgi:hypothetical protein